MDIDIKIRRPEPEREDADSLAFIKHCVELARTDGKNFRANAGDIEEIFEEFMDTVRGKSDDGVSQSDIVLAEVAGGVVGYALYNFDTESKIANIDQLCVDKHFRDLGIGKRLVDYVIDECEGQNCRRVVVVSTRAAEKFWESLGFENEGENTGEMYKDLETRSIELWAGEYRN